MDQRYEDELHERRRIILSKVARGEMPAEQANRLLALLESGLDGVGSPEDEQVNVPVSQADAPAEPVPPLTPPVYSASPAAEPEPEPLKSEPQVIEPDGEEEMRKRLKQWQRLWVIPFAVGLFLTVISAYWMYAGYQAAGLSWGFWLSWFPFILGLAVTYLSYASRAVPWVYINVQNQKEEGSTSIRFAVPLPVGLTAWGFRTFDRYMPEDMRGKNIGEALNTLDQSITADAPLHIVVDEGETNKVEIAIIRPA